ncbi:MAG TPA: hypothetical protein VI793_15500 [Anaerolineales bacterium]|nr:hypothetical protein [Anaerolineales bacterium]
MYQSDTEMLFPSRVIPSLKRLRGPAWRHLVEEVEQEEDGDEDNLAFGLMMIRLNGCLTCQSDSYKAMRGCTACAQQMICRFKDSDEALIKLFKQAKQEVNEYLCEGTLVDA